MLFGVHPQYLRKSAANLYYVTFTASLRMSAMSENKKPAKSQSNPSTILNRSSTFEFPVSANAPNSFLILLFLSVNVYATNLVKRTRNVGKEIAR